nr:hypothetical protein [uncultured Cupriavidus sp.]
MAILLVNSPQHRFSATPPDTEWSCFENGKLLAFMGKFQMLWSYGQQRGRPQRSRFVGARKSIDDNREILINFTGI